MASKVMEIRNNKEIDKDEKFDQDSHACGDHGIVRSESGVELKSLLRLIDDVIVQKPAIDEPNEPYVPPPGFRSSMPFVDANCYYPRSTNNESGDGRVTLSEKLLAPVKMYPKYNFVGRILGPRGMTVKQLEKETGCKIFVRGRASSTAFNPHTKAARLSPQTVKTTLSNISQSSLTEDPLHVLIECTDFPSNASKKLAHAVSVIKDLLSPPADGKDELKRQQLVDISLINGTYRPTSSSGNIMRPTRRPNQTQSVDPTSNPADFDLKSIKMEHGTLGHGDIGSVYGIAQQKRVWQKPRGPDVCSEEYAKSVSSREFVTDIVNKTKKSPMKKCAEQDDSVFNLPQSVVSESLKVAKNLLASHQHMSYTSSEHKKKDSVGKEREEQRMLGGAGDRARTPSNYRHDYKSASPVPSLMASSIGRPTVSPLPSPSLLGTPFDFYLPPNPYSEYPIPPPNPHFFVFPPPLHPFSRRF